MSCVPVPKPGYVLAYVPCCRVQKRATDKESTPPLPPKNQCGGFKWSQDVKIIGNDAEGIINGIKWRFTSSVPVTLAGFWSIINIQKIIVNKNGVDVADPYNMRGVGPANHIANNKKSKNVLAFEVPILNPVLVFGSIGRADEKYRVSIKFEQPGKILWSENTRQDSPYEISGVEGIALVEFEGMHQQLNFEYTEDESYASFLFGANFDQPC